MESNRESGKIQVTSRFIEAIMNYNLGFPQDENQKFRFEDWGEIEIKGKGMMKTWFFEKVRKKKYIVVILIFLEKMSITHK